MIEVGRLCIKLTGRDAGKKAVVVDVIDKNFVLIDGETRRRKCNISHLDPLEQTLKIKKNATHEEVVNEFSKLGIKLKENQKKEKTRQQTQKTEKKETKKPSKEKSKKPKIKK